MLRISRHLVLLSFLAFAASACGSGTGPDGRPGIAFVAGTSLADTVLSKPLQALVVELRGPFGVRERGTVVRFETRPNPSPAGGFGAYLSALDGVQFATLVVQTTDARGRASVRVQLGSRAGPAYIVVSVPELGMQDSIAVTVRPGAPHQVVIGPADTALLVGRSFTVRANSADRFGNALSAVAVALSTSASELTLAGSTVTGTNVGRASVGATAGAFQTTLWVSVVPQGTLAASSSGITSASGIRSFQLDGSELRVVTDDVAGMLSWSPGGATLAYDRAPHFGYGTPARVVDLNGNIRPVSNPPVSSIAELAPSYSRTGDWVYFSAISSGGPEVFRLYRVHANGTGAELVPNQSAEDDFFPSVSPDGARVVYVRRTGWAEDYLRVLDVNTGVVSKIDVPGHSPAWSPTGDLIAYIDMAAGWVIKTMRPDGTDIRQVSAVGATYERGLTWSPDGRWIAARSTSTGLLDLIEAASGLTIPLPFTYGMAFPAWKP